MAILAGFTVLLVEDEPLIALDVQDCLQEKGALVFWAPEVKKATELIEQIVFTAAVIDYELNGANSDSVCERLRDRRIPFLFYSGSAADQLRELCETAPLLVKPVACGEIANAVRRLARRGASARSSPKTEGAGPTGLAWVQMGIGRTKTSGRTS